MIHHRIVEEALNREGKKILLLIKEDYYQFMSDEKKQFMDRLIHSDFVVVNQGQSIFKDNTLAHGGRALRDDKIHFYPDVRGYQSDEETIVKCRRILLHECFHYFLQPDKVKHDDTCEKMLHDYTEGLVEKESREFYARHKNEIDFEEANYGFNICFVELVQRRLNLGSKEVIFGPDDYLKSILDFAPQYGEIEKQKEKLIDCAKKISQEFPKDMQRKVFYKMKTLILQNGNADIVQEKLQQLDFIKADSIKMLKEQDILEL